MPQSVTEQVKIWSAPAMLAVILAMAALIWSGQENKIATLEAQVRQTSNSLALITANQQNSAEDRGQFQDSTTKRLDRMEDLLGAMSSAVTRLAALQEREASNP
jgi:hypothetical protein